MSDNSNKKSHAFDFPVRRTENAMPPRTEPKPKTVRKPLRDLSNNNGGEKLTKLAELNKKSTQKQIGDEASDDDGALDQLLLVKADLCSLLQQIDELAVQAFKVKTTSKQGRKEVESFTTVLSDVLSTLKPWAPRFQKMISSPIKSEEQLGESLTSKTLTTSIDENVCDFGSPEDFKEDTLISPSPLVSWRANCTIERGRQLFLLTPLPMPKSVSMKCQDPSKSVVEMITSNNTVEIFPPVTINGDANNDLLEGVAIKSTPSKPSDSTVAGKRDPSIFLMTPCLKMSPPRSCVLLEPISETSHRPYARFRKSTPFPFGLQRGSPSSESSSSEDSDDLAFKYPELLGIRQACKSGRAKKDLEASPLWKFSPPKSCVLLEPLDDVSTESAAADAMFPVASVANPQLSPSLLNGKEHDVQIACSQTNNSCPSEPFDLNSAFIESTLLWKEPESTFRTGKHPGENTLKKELWMRFEAASSTFRVGYNTPATQRTSHKGFLDMLEEASGDERNSVLDGAR